MSVPLTRRVFLHRIGSTTLAWVALGLGACSDDTGSTATSATGTASTVASGSTTLPANTTAPTLSTTVPVSRQTGNVSRLALGSVSAFLLARGDEVAVIDTGNAGDVDSVEAGIVALGLGWDDVAWVVVTHRHPDHVGSLDAVLSSAPRALAMAGIQEVDSITSDRRIIGLGNGEEFFGLETVSSPGHTAGHICLYDVVDGALFAGDALTSSDGRLNGPNARFTADMDRAIESIRRLATFDVSAVYVGHGDPITEDAAAQLTELAESL